MPIRQKVPKEQKQVHEHNSKQECRCSRRPKMVMSPKTSIAVSNGLVAKHLDLGPSKTSHSVG